MKLHVVQIAAYLVIIAAGIKLAAPVLNVVFLALLIGTSVLPLLIWLMKKGVPKSLALLITILSLFIIITLIASVVSAAVIGLADKLPQYQDKLISLKEDFITLFSGLGINISDMLSLQEFDSQNIINLVKDFISGIISTFSNFALIILLIIFLLLDVADMHYNIIKGKKEITPAMAKRMELRQEIHKYNSISAFTGMLTAIGNLILLLIIGVDFPFLWAFLSFLFSFIPSIGFILSVIPPAFIAMLESGPTSALIVLVGFIVINGIVENVIRPKFMGKELNLSLTLIFLSLIFWTWILGAMGAILAIPLTIAVLKAKEIFFKDSILYNMESE